MSNYVLVSDNINSLDNSINYNPSNSRENNSSLKIRFNCIDIFRGLSIVAMILANSQIYLNPKYFIFTESYWNGLTPVDCISTLFLFIMGFSIIFVKKENKFTFKILIKIILRFLILSLIGLFLNFLNSNYNSSEFDFEKIRIPSVLFRLGLTYLIISILSLFTIYLHFILIALSLTVNAYYTYSYYVPHCGKGYTTPSCFFGGYFDYFIFTKHHMILPTDPEGLFSTLNSLCPVFVGYLFAMLAKRILKNFSYNILQVNNTGIHLNLNYKLFYYWTSICILNLMFGIFCWVFLNIEFNKKIFSISFTFMTTFISSFILIIVFSLTDIFRKSFINKILNPFIWLGRNSLFIYVGHLIILNILNDVIVDKMSLVIYIQDKIINSLVNNRELSSLIFGGLHVLFWVVISSILYLYDVIVRI